MVVIVFTVGAAVKPAANSLPENTKEPEPTPPTTEAVQQEPYPFNLMSLDWSGEELEGWTRYEVPEDYADNGGYLPECMKAGTDGTPAAKRGQPDICRYYRSGTKNVCTD